MLYELTLYAIAGLTALVLGAAALVLAIRIVSDLRRASADRRRGRMMSAIDSYRVGHATLDRVLPLLAADRTSTLEALVLASRSLARAHRPVLLPLYEHFGFVAREVDALGHRRWPRRLAAASRLGVIGDRDSAIALVEALDDDLLDVRLAAAHALAELEAGDAVVPILRSLAMPGEVSSRLAADALLDMGGAAVGPLVAFLAQAHGNEDLAAILVAIQVVGERRAAHAVPSLIALLGHEQAELRLNAARALGQIGDARALEPLCRFAHDPIWGVRSAAAQALGRLGDRRALSTLSGRLIDRAWWVRYNAAQALYGLGDEGRERLLDTVAKAVDRYARDISLQVLQQHERRETALEARA